MKSLVDWVGVRFLYHATAITLSGAKIGDKELQKIAKIQTLQSVHFVNTSCTAETLDWFARACPHVNVANGSVPLPYLSATTSPSSSANGGHTSTHVTSGEDSALSNIWWNAALPAGETFAA